MFIMVELGYVRENRAVRQVPSLKSVGTSNGFLRKLTTELICSPVRSDVTYAVIIPPSCPRKFEHGLYSAVCARASTEIPPSGLTIIPLATVPLFVREPQSPLVRTNSHLQYNKATQGLKAKTGNCTSSSSLGQDPPRCNSRGTERQAFASSGMILSRL